jgi:nicotinate-nucleotide adenylyltransferase
MTGTIAVYGGSFDPPHIGHVLVCAYVLAAQPVERLLVVPVGTHPFAKRLAPFEDRLHMCELALGDLRRIEISPIERELPGPSLTLRTLECLQDRYPGSRLRLVIGSDLVPETPTWFDYERVCEIAPPIVVPRAGYASPEAEGPALPDINSTDLRSRLRVGLPTSGLLSPSVADYAMQRKLYA